ITSMPASRSARAITLAPRSCPSRPGLATSTRIGRDMVYLEVRLFLVSAEHRAERVADLAQRCISLHRVQNIRHGVSKLSVFRAFGRAQQRIQRLPHPAIVAPLA